MERALLVLALVVVVLAPFDAQADVLDETPPPETVCPPGSVVDHFSHSDPGTCVATTCEDDSDCTGGTRCMRASLCVDERPAGETPGTHPIAWSCDDCPTDVECVEAMRCVAPAPPPAAGCARCIAGASQHRARGLDLALVAMILTIFARQWIGVRRDRA